MRRSDWIPWAVLVVALSTAPRAATAAGSAPQEDHSAPLKVAEMLARGAESMTGPGEIHIRFSPPPFPEQAHRMVDWHRRYRARMEPVKEAWLEALRAVDRVGFADPAARGRLAERCAGPRPHAGARAASSTSSMTENPRRTPFRGPKQRRPLRRGWRSRSSRATIPVRSGRARGLPWDRKSPPDGAGRTRMRKA